MSQGNKLRKRIYQLATKKGYSYIKLNPSEYMNVLQTAHDHFFKPSKSKQ